MRANCQRAARTAASGAGVNSENHAVLKSREIPLYSKEKLSTPRIVNVRWLGAVKLFLYKLYMKTCDTCYVAWYVNAEI